MEGDQQAGMEAWLREAVDAATASLRQQIVELIKELARKSDTPDADTPNYVTGNLMISDPPLVEKPRRKPLLNPPKLTKKRREYAI